MPDGDIIRGLGRRYQKPYKELCEGKATSDECARSLMRSLKQDIKAKGDIPVMLAKSMGESLDQAMSVVGETSAVDWATLSLGFDRLAHQVNGPSYLKELVLRAGKSVLSDLRYRREIDAACASEAILRRYMTEVYESEFKESIPLTPEHHLGIDKAILKQRIEEIEPNIFSAIHQWAKKADLDKSVRKLRQPSLPKMKEIDHRDDEDLLAVHNHNNSIKIGEILQHVSENAPITTQDWKRRASSLDGYSS